MRLSARARSLVVAAALAASVAAPAAARADALAPDENVRLMRGETITRLQTIDRGERHYVGGITYTIVDASAAELGSLLEDVRAYQQILPRTKSARVVGRDGDDLFVELRQGNAIAEASYTIRVRRDVAKHEVRFWLDPTRPHGIEDAWGFFRYEPLAQVSPGVPRVLLTFGVLVDVGDGIVRALFEERLRAIALTVPQRVREYAWRELRRGRA